MDIDAMLTDLVQRNGSDLHLRVGRPPLLRLNGELHPADLPVIDKEAMSQALRVLIGEVGLQHLHERGDQDAAYSLPGVGRFRVNSMKHMGQFGAVIRAIPLQIPTIERLGLPAILNDLLETPQGLILVTGPTGSGKSTTLAAMLDRLNDSEPLHVVTIEDPIEFVYEDRKCTFTQRQLGVDTPDLQEALKRTLRQDPDVILMGEMRDRETIEFGMHAAETGHLVFSTLHTNDAKQTIDRVLDSFPIDALKQVRSVLSLTLHAVLSQRLIRRADGPGRTAVMEILVNSPQVKELIAEGKAGELDKAMKSGAYYGMQSFNQALVVLVRAGTVSEEDALAGSTNPGDLKLLLRGVSGSTAGVPMPTPAAASHSASPAAPLAHATSPAGAAASVPPADGTKSSDTKTKITRGFKF